MIEDILIPVFVFFAIVIAAGLSFMLWFLLAYVSFLYHEWRNGKG